jgi:cardiolipin synthase A/B
LHAKVAVADGHWATIGSFNINNISAFASLELNLEVRNKPFAQMLQQELDAIIAKDCIQVTEKSESPNTTLWIRFLQKSAYELIRLVFNLTTFYFKPH